MSQTFDPESAGYAGEAEWLLITDVPAPMPDRVKDRQKALLRAQIAADLAGAPKQLPNRVSHRRRRGIIAALAGLGVFAGGGVATAHLFAAHPQETRLARCFSHAAGPFEMGSPGTYDVAYSDGAGDNTGTASLAIELCTHGWASGELPRSESLTGSSTHSEREDYPVPNLVGCVLPDGIVGVFPGESGTCTKLGLPNSLA